MRSTGLEYFSVVLDIKSRSVTANLLSAMVAELNTRGIHVAGVGSFILEEIAGVSNQTQIIDGEVPPPAREVWFMHYAGDLQARLAEGAVPAGQSVMFNGASLLEADTMVSGANASLRDSTIQDSYRVKEDVVAELREAQQEHGLHIGLYVQEGDTDATAADLLTRLTNREAATFDLGFAWGGLRDQATAEMTADVGNAHLGYGGQGALGYVGAADQWETSD